MAPPPPKGFIPAAWAVFDLETKLSKLTRLAPAPPRKSLAVFFAGAAGVTGWGESLPFWSANPPNRSTCGWAGWAGAAAGSPRAPKGSAGAAGVGAAAKMSAVGAGAAPPNGSAWATGGGAAAATGAGWAGADWAGADWAGAAPNESPKASQAGVSCFCCGAPHGSAGAAWVAAAGWPWE